MSSKKFPFCTLLLMYMKVKDCSGFHHFNIERNMTYVYINSIEVCVLCIYLPSCHTIQALFLLKIRPDSGSKLQFSHFTFHIHYVLCGVVLLNANEVVEVFAIRLILCALYNLSIFVVTFMVYSILSYLITAPFYLSRYFAPCVLLLTT